MKITEKQLKEWRKSGYRYDEIAEFTGKSPKTINYYVKKYGLSKQKRITIQERKQFCAMRKSGYSTKKIAELTGRSQYAINKTLKAAGLINSRIPKDKTEVKENKENAKSMILTPAIISYAKKRKPKITKTIENGIRYKDITDLFLPW